MSLVQLRRKYMTGDGPPQDLLHGAGQVPGWVAHEQLVLVGVLEERVHAVRDRVAGGLVAGHGEQQEEEVEVHVGQRVAVDLGARAARVMMSSRRFGAPLLGQGRSRT